VAAAFAALFALNCYRAATQSVTHDEALTWEIYLAGPASNIFDHFDANHHFLGTVLERLSTGLLGTSELTLRLPALLAGALYLVTAYRLSVLAFGGGPLFALASVLLVANPLVLDFLVAARGYGLALAFLFCALTAMIGHLAAGAGASDWKRLWRAGAALGLAVAANLTFAAPALALAAVFLVLLARRPAPPAKPKRRRKANAPPSARSEAAHFAIPLGAVGLLYALVAPLTKARAADFYVGVDSAIQSLRSLAAVSFAHNSGIGGVNAPPGPWLAVLAAVLPCAAVTAAAFGAVRVLGALRNGRAPGALDATLLLAGCTVVGAALCLLAMHSLAGLPYPGGRTGLYLLPLEGLCVVAIAAGLLRHAAPFRLAGIAMALLGAVMAGEYVLQLNQTAFHDWRYDADSKAILDRINADRRGRAPVRIGVSWQLEPSFNFYRFTRNWTWMPVFNRNGPYGDYDYYVVIVNDYPVLHSKPLREIYRGPNSETVLAASPHF